MFRPAALLATLVAPTHDPSPWAAVTSTSKHTPVGYPNQVLDMLAVRIGQLTARGLSPRQIHGLVGCSKDFHLLHHAGFDRRFPNVPHPLQNTDARGPVVWEHRSEVRLETRIRI